MYTPLRTGDSTVDRNLDSLKAELDKVNRDSQQSQTVSVRAFGSVTVVDTTTPIVTFTNIDWNSGDSFVIAGRFTAPQDGRYRVSPTVRTSSVAWAANNVLELYIFKNGFQYSILDRRNQAAATLIVMAEGSDDVQLKRGEYIDIRCFSQVSVTLNGGGTQLSIDRIGTYA